MKTLNLKCKITLTALLAFSMNIFSQSDILWKKNFGGAGIDRYSSVAELPDGIVAVGNSSYTSFGTGDWMMMLPSRYLSLIIGRKA